MSIGADGADIRGGEWKIVVSSPPFFRDSAGTIWEFRTCFLPGFFQSSTEFSWKWPNKLSQFGHNVQNIRLVNTVSISFNTRKTTERSQQKTGFYTFLLKNLWTTLKPHFNKIWSKSYGFQNKATIICKRCKGGSSTTILGHFSKSLPRAPKFSHLPLSLRLDLQPCSHYSETEVKE